MLVELTRLDGHPLKVNPAEVVGVERPSVEVHRDSCCIVTLITDRWVVVRGSIQEVTAKLEDG